MTPDPTAAARELATELEYNARLLTDAQTAPAGLDAFEEKVLKDCRDAAAFLHTLSQSPIEAAAREWRAAKLHHMRTNNKASIARFDRATDALFNLAVSAEQSPPGTVESGDSMKQEPNQAWEDRFEDRVCNPAPAALQVGSEGVFTRDCEIASVSYKAGTRWRVVKVQETPNEDGSQSVDIEAEGVCERSRMKYWSASAPDLIAHSTLTPPPEERKSE